MKKTTILNLITLLVTLFLLIFVVRAWYVSNEEVSITGANGGTSSDNFTLELERGTYSNSSWTWENTNSLAISEMQPGDAFFFRFKITASNSGSFKVSLHKLESALQEGSFQRTAVTTGGTTKYYVTMNGTKLYEMINATTAKITDGDNVAHTLYTYDEVNQKFELADYKIEDCFKYYDYGKGDSTFFNSHANAIGSDYLHAYDVTNALATYTIDTTTSNVWYGYFALEFNEEYSNKSYKHMDGIVKEDSNLFLSQIFNIKEFALEEI